MAENNIYGPQKVDYSDQIVKVPPMSPPPPSTGYESKAAGTLGLIQNLFAGIGKGRMYRAVAEERQKTQKLNRFISWGDSILQNPNIDPNAKAAFSSEFQHALLSEGTGALDHSIKGDGKKNPILSGLKHVLTGMAGGEVVKSKYDMKAIEDVITKYHDLPTDPKYDVQTQTTGALQNLRAKISEVGQSIKSSGKEPTIQAVRQQLEQQYPDLIPRAERWLGPGKVGPILDQEMKAFTAERAPTAAELKQQQEDKLRKEIAATPGGRAPNDQPPAARSAPTPATGTPPAAQFTAPDGTTGQGRPENYSATVTATAVPPAPRVAPLSGEDLEKLNKIGLTKDIDLWYDGKKQAASRILPNSLNKQPGFVDEHGNYLDPSKINLQDPNSPEGRKVETARVLSEKRREMAQMPATATSPSDTPKLIQEERDYLKAYSLITPPKAMRVNGKEREIAYTEGGNGIKAGFVDAVTGEYIDQTRISAKATKDSYRVVVDDKGKYGSRGARYVLDVDTGKPLKDSNGDVVRPPESQVSTIQKQFTALMARGYSAFKVENDRLDREQAQKLSALDTVKITDPGQSTARNLNAAEKAARAAQIVETYKGLRKQNKVNSDNLMRAQGSLYGIPVVPFAPDGADEIFGGDDAGPDDFFSDLQ